jgi:hypothetical protein
MCCAYFELLDVPPSRPDSTISKHVSGSWIFHCHILNHQQTGMFMLFQVGDRADLPTVPENFPKCGNYIPSISYSKSSGTGNSKISVIYISALVICFIRIGQ